MHQLGKHTVRTTFLNLAKSSEHGKFIIGHAHVGLNDVDAKQGISENMLTSSAWMYVSVIGSSSAVGMASRKLWPMW